MGSTKEKIANMALGHVGQAGDIANLSADRTPAGIVCNSFYDTALEDTLEEFAWPEFSAFVTLGLVEEDPNDDWAYSYRYPSSAVAVRRIVTSAGRTDPNPPPFEIGQDDQGKLIYTDQPDAVVKITQRITDEARFSSSFAMAMSWKLAELIAWGVTRDKATAERASKGAVIAMQKARIKAANERQDDKEIEAETVRDRD